MVQNRRRGATWLRGAAGVRDAMKRNSMGVVI
jgi:hypothetical protein